MSYYKAVFDAGRPLSVKVPEERDIHSKMSTNPLFIEPPVSYADFLLALDEQDTAIQNAEFGGIERIAAKNSKARVVDDIVRNLKAYVTVKANGDTDIILSSGFRHTKPREGMSVMPKVQGVKRFSTEISGELKLLWNPVHNVGFYEVQVRSLGDAGNTDGQNDPGNPMMATNNGDEDEWIKHSARPAKILITGLKPLIYYAIRVRASGTKGFGAFSDALVVMVI